MNLSSNNFSNTTQKIFFVFCYVMVRYVTKFRDAAVNFFALISVLTGSDFKLMSAVFTVIAAERNSVF